MRHRIALLTTAPALAVGAFMFIPRGTPAAVTYTNPLGAVVIAPAVRASSPVHGEHAAGNHVATGAGAPVLAAAATAPVGVPAVEVLHPAPASLTAAFATASAEYDLPVGLLQSVSWVESRYDASVVSGAGAEGAMQLMPATAAGLGANPYDTTAAIFAAARMLSSLERQFNSLPLAVAAYNAGPGAVSAWGGVPPDAQDYVDQVLSLTEPSQ